MSTRTEWAKRVRGWKKSGLTAREYGRREGFDGGQLSWWRWQLGAKAKRIRRSRAPSKRPAFLPARLVSAPQSTPERGSSSIDIVLGNGRVVRVGAGVDAELLDRVLGVASRSRG